MINFKELPVDGILFEQFVRELYMREGYEIHWTGVGSDGGRDLVLTEKLTGSLSTKERKWLISCKHRAHSGKSVGVKELGDFSADCNAIDAEGFILACSTQPSSATIKRLDESSSSKKILTRYEDAISLEKKLMHPNTFNLINQFFPLSAKSFEWQIYNAYSPSFWCAHFKDYFFYMSSRDATTFPDLIDVENIIVIMESVHFLENELFQSLRLRSVYYDNKHCTYIAFIDYLVDRDVHRDKKLSPGKIRKMLIDKFVELDFNKINMPDWDVLEVDCNVDSDHYHGDHKSYYEPYIADFKSGNMRTYI